MSAQMGGKKSGGSSNSSMVNTPASTPVATMANGQQSTPPPNNAPKYGTLVPNRIFVGGISANTTETELLQLFSNYGTVKAAKIIQDRAGVSKGYGFITFDSEDDAKRLQREADNIILRERKLNIAPAIKKQPFNRAFDGSSPPAVASGYPPNFFTPGSMPFFQGGVAYYPQPPSGPADPSTQPPTVYQTPSVYPPQSAPPQAAPYQPVMFPPQPIYMPQQYPMPMPYDYNYYPNGGQSYMLGGPGGGGGQNGGSGPQSSAATGCQPQPMQQRGNSPPRQQVYSHPLPPAVSAAGGGYANPQELYYNMYPIEGTMYADPGQGIETMSLSNGVMSEEYQQQEELLSGGGCSPQAAKGHGVGMQASDTSRQTTTPVVSLLSLDHQQEKDLMSMQSGRRRKPPPVTPTQQPVVSAAPIPLLIPNFLPPPPPQELAMPLPNGYNTYPPMPYEFHFAPVAGNYHRPQLSQKPQHVNGYYHNSSNIYNNKRTSWKNYDHRRSVDNSSLSSPRTDSNSSANCAVDDSSRHIVNNVDDKRRYSQPQLSSAQYQHRFQPPHSPFPRRGVYLPGRSAQYRNSNRQSYTADTYPHHHHNTQHNTHQKINGANNTQSQNHHKLSTAALPPRPPSPASATPTGNNAFNANLNANNSNSQMPNVGVNVGIPQHFVAPARQRNRRGMGRRGIGEIGAGDAPLSASANQDNLADACNKMDGLKL